MSEHRIIDLCFVGFMCSLVFSNKRFQGIKFFESFTITAEERQCMVKQDKVIIRHR